MSYPDITLVQSICSVLEISEHELLTGSEDTQKRTSERLAARYLKLTRNYRLSQYILYGLILAGCAIGNICASHTLDWFFIALAGVLMGASLTLAPALAALHPNLSKCKMAVSIGSFLGSLELLLLVCCLYSGGDWFPVAGMGVLFGVTLVFLPLLLPLLPLPACLAERKASLYLITEILLLLLLLLVCCIYTEGDWFVITMNSVIFGLGFLILPVLLRQLPIPDAVSKHKSLIYFSVQTVLLFSLLLVIDLHTKAGLFFTMSLPIAAACLVLPWGMMLMIRYLPISGWFRASLSAALVALWVWLFPYVLDRILTWRYGPSMNPYPLLIPFDFSSWGGNQTTMNVMAIIIFSLSALSSILAIAGVWRGKRLKQEVKGVE